MCGCYERGVTILKLMIQLYHGVILLISVEKAGGHCLPCVVDIREESQVEKAVSDAVARFGGIDILVNNASAIHLTGTVNTPMKRYENLLQ